MGIWAPMFWTNKHQIDKFGCLPQWGKFLCHGFLYLVCVCEYIIACKFLTSKTYYFTFVSPYAVSLKMFISFNLQINYPYFSLPLFRIVSNLCMSCLDLESSFASILYWKCYILHSQYEYAFNWNSRQKVCS